MVQLFMEQDKLQKSTITLSSVFQLWWPLAGSWALMGLELPAVSAIMARLAEPEIHLAAYGGVVFPISLLIEAPVIMLLAASTALSKDWNAYRFLRRFMLQLACSLTLLHILVAFTPLYDVVVIGVLGVPNEIVEPARMGLMLMTPWTAAIAVRRFQQGLLIRFGHTHSVGIGTAVRLSANGTVLLLGLFVGDIPGIVVGTAAVSLGVMSEALFIHIRVQPLLRILRDQSGATSDSLTLRQLLTFYLPLAVTPLLTLLSLPIGSAALSRMPRALESLAVWPVLAGLSFTMRSFGLAYQEVVVALIERPGSIKTLRRFAEILGVATSGLLLVIASTPLATVWFADLAGLSPELTALGASAIWLAIFMPALSVIESFFQGMLVQSRRTKAIIQAVIIYLFTNSTILVGGTYYGQVTGLYIGVMAVVLGHSLQSFWLWKRSPSLEV
ncbi:MAG: hypothetical protein JSU59_07845 [Nitrospirota bacterium]|nr:MAG: hypothetical protein JSU59_07845 [Nitrospirota bacterium]